MTNIVKQEIINGYRVEVVYDEDPFNPRKDFCNFGTIVLADDCRYDFGDAKLSSEYLEEIASNPDLIVLPVYVYDHGGITSSTSQFSCKWDSCQVGVIYASKSDALFEFSAKEFTDEVRRKVVDLLVNEIKILDSYLTGDVYGYKVYDPEGEEVDTCYGYIGDLDYCLQDGISTAEGCYQHDIGIRKIAWRKALKEARERRYWEARGLMTGNLVFDYV